MLNAKEAKDISDNANKLFDLEKELEKILEQIFKNIDTMAQSGHYSSVFITEKYNMDIIKLVGDRLLEEGYKIEIQDLGGNRKSIRINWE